MRELTEAEWNWAELVIISGMIVQKEDWLAQIRAGLDSIPGSGNDLSTYATVFDSLPNHPPKTR